MRHPKLVVVAGVAGIALGLIPACSQQGEQPGTVKSALTDGGGPPPTAHCCVAPAADASCTVNAVIEPCWSTNAAGNYGLWTCSSGPCSENGRSCAVGDTCTLPDIGCTGVVKECAYPWGN
jgi:hypothetical protein